MPQNGPPRVAIVGGLRTPFAKAGTVFRDRTALDLALHAVNGLIDKHHVDVLSVDLLAYGIVVLDPRIPHLAREVVLRSYLMPTVRALTLTDNCITGISAIQTVADAIRQGEAEVGIAGGVESMSNPAFVLRHQAAHRLIDLGAARSLKERLRRMLRLRPADFWPQVPGVKEPSTGLSMGEHCELMVKEWEVGREAQDEIAYRSHMNAHAATEDGRLLEEIIALDGIFQDLLIRPETNLEKLSTLRPVFDRSPTGTITAGNASPLTDGAASVLLMSEARAVREGRTPLAFIRGIAFASIDPEEGLLMAPAVAVPRLLKRTGLSLAEMQIVEMHEAFGGQVACNLKAWEDGWKEPAIGPVDPIKLNPLGGSIALGHPFAATGARMATTLANEMSRCDARYGLISVCGAGGTAAAMILERD